MWSCGRAVVRADRLASVDVRLGVRGAVVLLGEVVQAMASGAGSVIFSVPSGGAGGGVA
jgi:hypothetical protein